MTVVTAMLLRRLNTISVGIITLLIFSTNTFSQTQLEKKPLEQPAQVEKTVEWIKLLSPLTGATVVDKKPLVKCTATIPFSREGLVVMLDDTDITNIIDISKDGFEFQPIQILSPGQHSLKIALKTPEKKEYKQEFSFTVRHSQMFEEIASTNDVSILYEGMTQRRTPKGQTDTTPYSKIEGNISSNSKIMEKGFEGALTANIRYIDQSESLTPPAFKGFNVANYLLSLKYQTEKAQFLAETGDIQINETQNTIGLSRRGVKLNVGLGDFKFSTFSVKAKQVSGLRDFKNDSGFAFDSADKIEGASGEIDLFDKKANFKVIYAKGRDQGTSYGSWSPGGGKAGDITAFVFKTNLFSQRLTTEMEYDASKFDQDTSDTLPASRDKAYRLKIGGTAGAYNYEGLYEFFGTNFSSIGNTGVQKDTEGFALKGGGTLDVHTANLSLSRYNDNVQNSPLLPKTYTYQGGVDYSFSKFKSLPMGFGYQTTLLESKNETVRTLRKHVRTDNLTGKINFQKDSLNLGFNINYAHQYDYYVITNDNTNVTFTFTPTYSSDKFSATSSFSLNRLSYDFSRVVTDTYTANLGIRGNLYDNKVTYEVTYNFNKAMKSDDSTSSESTDINFRSGYLLAKQRFGLVNPTVGIRGNYSFSHDLIGNIRSDKNFIFLFFSANMPISF
jgi:hypothetical protein